MTRMTSVPTVPTMFGFLNALARSRGMPDDYEIYYVSMVGKHREGNKVKLTGDRPIGFRFDGRPIWPASKKQGANPKSVIITTDEYRAALAAYRAGQGQQEG